MAEYDREAGNDTNMFRPVESDGTSNSRIKFYLNPKYAILEDLDIPFSTNNIAGRTKS